MCKHDDAVVPITGTVFDTLKRTLYKEVRLAFMRLPNKLRWKFKIGLQEIKRRKGESFCVLKTSSKDSPEALQGYHGKHLLMIVDEASGVAEEVFEAASGSMSTPGAIMVMAGNPTRLTGTFYDSHHRQAHLWTRFHFSCVDSPLVAESYPIEIIDKYGEGSNQHRIRVLGDFPTQEDDTLISLSDITAAIERIIPIDENADLVYGLDIADKGNDLSIKCRRRGDNALSLDIVKNKNTTDLIGMTLRSAHKENADIINLDEIGIGAGVRDGLQEQKRTLCPRVKVCGICFAGKAKSQKDYHNIRAEGYCEIRDRFISGEISIPDDPELVAELSTIRYTVTSAGRILIEPKEQMKKRLGRSPDRADGLVLAFYEPRKKRYVGTR